MVVENSPIGSSQSNGIVERAIQFVQGMFRRFAATSNGGE